MDIPSGVQIANWFNENHAKRLHQFQTADGLDLVREGTNYCYVWLTSYVDMDYEGYFLLEVRTSNEDTETRDFLVVRLGCKGMACEWYNKPIRTTEPAHEHRWHLRDGMVWFADWIQSDLEVD